jgi:hypothetical protein
MGLDDFKSKSGPYYEYENRVEYELKEHLREDGFDINSTDRPDIIAKKDGERLVIEVKRHYEEDRRQQVYTVIGQIIYRMNPENLEQASPRFIIALPRDIDGAEIYRKDIQKNVPRDILEMLSISTILVDTEGYEVIEPGDIGSK